MESVVEDELRRRIMGWVVARAEANGGFLERSELLDFHIDDRRFPIIDRSRGIRNPAIFASTLSIVQSVHGPYADTESEDGFLHYAYQAGDPWGGANNKLREAISTGAPLILFRKEQPNIYTPIAPVYVVDDDVENREFIIALDEALRFIPDVRQLDASQRAYARRLAKVRLHQPAFRTRVLVAYKRRCSICLLAHGSLLDAAHIVPDSEPLGVPTVVNGLSLCKIHHAAYDQNFIGISPDSRVVVDDELLAERDGPMLKHGLQEMHGRVLLTPDNPSHSPNRENLAWRFERFLARA